MLVFEHKALYGRKEEFPGGEHVLPLGQARTVRVGNDVTLVGLSITVGTCLAAPADQLLPMASGRVAAEVRSRDLRHAVRCTAGRGQRCWPDGKLRC